MQFSESSGTPHDPNMSHDSSEQELAPPVRGFLDTISALAELLDRETELMKARRFKDAGALAEEKARLTAEFQSTLATLRAQDAALLGPKESVVRRKLKGAAEDLRARLARHARLVMRLRTMNENLVKTISREVQRQRGAVQRYSGTGQLGMASGQPASISLDRNI